MQTLRRAAGDAQLSTVSGQAGQWDAESVERELKEKYYKEDDKEDKQAVSRARGRSAWSV